MKSEPETMCGYDLHGEYLVQYRTGEVVPYSIVAVPYGSIIETPDARERKNRYWQEREERARKVRSNDPFTFIKKELSFKGVPPAMITRLIYLSSYMQYDGNKLMLSTRKAMTRKDLASVLGISPRNAVNFWSSLSPDFIAEDGTGALVLNEEIFKRGRRVHGDRVPCERIFQNGVRRLYEAANGKYHKQMGYLFELLPYINIEYNVLCWNSYEKDIHNIKPLSLADFCELVGYSHDNIDKLKKIYSGIRFPVGDREELFCKLVYDGIHSNRAKICINPRILYSGTRPKRSEVLELFFND